MKTFLARTLILGVLLFTVVILLHIMLKLITSLPALLYIFILLAGLVLLGRKVYIMEFK